MAPTHECKLPLSIHPTAGLLYSRRYTGGSPSVQLYCRGKPGSIEPVANEIAGLGQQPSGVLLMRVAITFLALVAWVSSAAVGTGRTRAGNGHQS